MTFEQLECFIAAVREDTFFNAAESMHMTQSALSKQIMKLERELDMTLFDRSRRTASLTEAGSLFYEEAKTILEQYRESMRRMNKYREQTAQALHIGTLPILSQYGLSSLIRNFSEQNPQVNTSVHEAEEDELLHGMVEGKFDIVIGRDSMFPSEQFTSYPLADDRLAAILPLTHPAAGRNTLSLTELQGESFILMQPHTSIYHLCIQLFRENDMKPKIIATARMESILGSVAAGDGISLLPEKNFQIFHHESLTGIPVAGIPPLQVVAACRKGEERSGCIRIFANYLQSRND